MAHEAFRKQRFNSASRDVIKRANEIVTDYKTQGYRMTLRQLYYQFVSRNWITNEERSYRRLASIISDARLCGLIDWEAIEDRGRQPDMPHFYRNTAHLLEVIQSSARNFTINKWIDQPKRGRHGARHWRSPAHVRGA